MSGLVQYVVVSGELIKALNWPLGAVIAQCCHATTAVGHLYRDDEDSKNYFNDLDNMHKVVLEAKSEIDLRSLSDELQKNEIKHKLWIENPENIATCIAIKPYPKDAVHKFVKKLKLFK